MAVGNLLSPSEIAEKLGCPLHKVQYIIRSRKIVEVQRGGNCRLFDAIGVSRVKLAMKEIADNKLTT